MTLANNRTEWAALLLRIGLGLVFVIGGISKLSQLLSSEKQEAMVANYMGTTGYINELFQDYLFSSDFLTPLAFLTTLSMFELLSGVALIVGFLVRPLALFYAFLLWSFVVSLPVDTVPGASVGVKTYTSPAIFVQIRDITLSGMMFVLFNLGSGAHSIERRAKRSINNIDWNTFGLLLRFSLGVTFIVGGFFGQYAKIPTFYSPQLLLSVIGLVLILGHGHLLRAAAITAMAVLTWFMIQKLNVDKSMIANLNGFKREFALFFAALVLGWLGGGERFTLYDLLARTKRYINNEPVVSQG